MPILLHSIVPASVYFEVASSFLTLNLLYLYKQIIFLSLNRLKGYRKCLFFVLKRDEKKIGFGRAQGQKDSIDVV